jgi:hypothetical protein
MKQQQLLNTALFVLLVTGCATRPEPGQDGWQPFNQAPVLAELQSHPVSRMRPPQQDYPG